VHEPGSGTAARLREISDRPVVDGFGKRVGFAEVDLRERGAVENRLRLERREDRGNVSGLRDVELRLLRREGFVA
jgi:hypothetical protein